MPLFRVEPVRDSATTVFDTSYPLFDATTEPSPDRLRPTDEADHQHAFPDGFVFGVGDTVTLYTGSGPAPTRTCMGE